MEKNYKKDTLFSTHIFRFENKDLALKLKEYIINLKKISGIESNIAPTIKNNLVESKFDFFQNNNDVIDEAKRFFAACIKVVLNDLDNNDDNYKIRFNESWYHIGKENSSHDVHTHTNCSWCGIFYLQSGDLDGHGETKFTSPIIFNYTDFGTTHLSEEIASVVPEDGKLVIFPSYLKHFQSLYSGSEDRIVVAFNSSIIDKIPT